MIPDLVILEQLDSIKSCVSWFQQNDKPDLAFFDIQLADGKSFEIFEQVEVSCPIIFTTAYDQYALKAFEVNSIDYLLKPIREDDLQRALKKYDLQGNHSIIDAKMIHSLIVKSSKNFKEQFLIKVGEHLKTVLISSTVCFHSTDRTTYLDTTEGKKYIVDYTLDQINDMVDPSEFFRINRKYIIKMSEIKDIISFSNSRLKIVMNTMDSENMIVARERVVEFKMWLDR
ncbi:MAG: response regulator transcription factor [Reichenbachiella sp.]